jgi:hypothetical protein
MPGSSNNRMHIPARSPRRPWYLWANLLSLDAPLVALAWQDLFARSFHVSLGPVPRAVTAGCVWLAYTGDRLLDAWRIARESLVTPRHQFARRNFLPLTAVWLAALPMTAYGAFGMLRRELVEGGVILSALVVGYFVFVHWPGRQRMWPGFKEGTVAALFCAGTVVFVVAKAGRLPSAAIAPMVFWVALCFLNCLGIGCWEKDFDLAQRQVSLPLQKPAVERHYGRLAMSVAGVALAAGLAERGGDFRALYFSVATSAFMLGGLHHFNFAFEINELRVAADFVLLTPLLFLPSAGA